MNDRIAARVFIIMMLSVCAMTYAKSVPATGPATKPATKPKTVPLSFKDAGMDQIAKFLCDQLNKPVIPHKDVTSIKITLINPKQLPPEEALEVLRTTLHEHGVAIEERAKTIHLIPIKQIIHAQIQAYGPDDDITAVKPNNLIVRKIFNVRHYDPEKLIAMLKPIAPEWGHMAAEPTTGKLIVVATVERIAAMAEIITELDKPDISGGELRVFHIKHVDVYEIVPMLEKLISSHLGVKTKATAAPPSRSGRRDRRSGPYGRGGAAAPAAVGAIMLTAEKKSVLLIPDPRRSAIVVAAPGNILTQIEVWLATLDQPKPPSTQYEIVEVHYGDAQVLADQLTDMLNKIPDESLQTALRIFPFASSRRLIIVGSDQNRELVKKWLKEIDVEDTGLRETKTFVLKHADAQQIAENVKELFSFTSRSGWARMYYLRSTTERQRVTVTANVRRNSITVVAVPEIMKRIEEQIAEWDKPFEGEEAAPRIYTLKYADPEQTKELLESLFTKKETRQFRWWWDDRDDETASPVGRLFGQFLFEAYPETGKLVVISKSEENYAVIEKMIEEIDSPQLAGAPRTIQLRYADAETLAEQLNALLNAPGTPTSILRRTRLGTFEGFSEFVSPYHSGAQETRQPQQDKDDTELKVMKFWWQNPPADIKIKQPSNLIGKLRIVPNVEQNLLLVAAPEEYADAIEQFVHDLDRPGYRVLIKAVIVEITHDDTTSLGFRFSSDPLAFASGDPIITENALRGLLEYTFEDTFGRQHTLTVDVDVNNLISLLGRITDVKIVSEPKIVAVDNVEAEFFDGQDVPFIRQSQLTPEGTRNDTFDYFPVGIRLRVRPHITKEKNVDLTVNLIVSSQIPGRTLFGGLIIDRRETTTRILLEDGKTFMISGILRQEQREIIRRIPGLGDIPLLGELFKHRELADVNSELIILLTPYVIGPDDPRDPIEAEPLDRVNEVLPDKQIGRPQTQPAK